MFVIFWISTERCHSKQVQYVPRCYLKSIHQQKQYLLMASSSKKKNKRKRKQTGSPFSNKKKKMADKKNSKNSKSKEQSPACSIPQTPQTNQETNQSPLTSNVYSAAHQTLYGSYPGYPFTPFQPPAPHTTPANMMQSHHQQLPPAMMSTMPLLTPSPYQYTNPDLNKFMGEVTERLKKLDMLEDILKRVVSMETHCMKID